VQLLGSKAMLRDAQITVEEVAAQLGASALDKHLPGGRSAASDGQ